MLDTLVVMLLSLAALVVSSQYAIKESVKLARFFRVSDAAIGLLLVSVATSLPELAVSVQSALRGEVGIGIGNVLGANVSDVCLGVGLCALAAGVLVRREEYEDLSKALIAASVLPFLMLFDLGNFLGVILLLVFLLYAMMMWREKVEDVAHGQARPTIVQAALAFAVFALAVAVVVYSSSFVVSSAVDFATALGVTRAFVAGVIISIGTTLPEISVSLAAIHRRNTSLALGNLVGSCVVNLTLVLGAAALIRPLHADFVTFLGLALFALLANLLLLAFVRRGQLGRFEGAVLVSFYALFVVMMFMNQFVRVV